MPFHSVCIFCSASSDKGRTWSIPTLLSEQPVASSDDMDYASFMPSIAVNRQGTVAVCWYDRRGLPKQGMNGSDNIGCNVRLRASLDGGATWLSSVQVNEKTIELGCGMGLDNLGDTAGLAADREGRFHAAWIDNRTGTRQVWTAAVNVENPVANANVPK